MKKTNKIKSFALLLVLMIAALLVCSCGDEPPVNEPDTYRVMVGVNEGFSVITAVNIGILIYIDGAAVVSYCSHIAATVGTGTVPISTTVEIDDAGCAGGADLHCCTVFRTVNEAGNGAAAHHIDDTLATVYCSAFCSGQIVLRKSYHSRDPRRPRSVQMAKSLFVRYIGML